jgi:hypothetical protein
VVCNKDYEQGDTFTLTEEEKAAIGPTAPDEVSYCSPCLRVMQDRTTGAELLKGLYEMLLRESGVVEHGVLSQRLYDRLIKPKDEN